MDIPPRLADHFARLQKQLALALRRAERAAQLEARRRPPGHFTFVQEQQIKALLAAAQSPDDD